ncbi:MAG: hypothetical protein QM791_15090 [Ferruginibacter sp.]
MIHKKVTSAFSVLLAGIFISCGDQAEQAAVKPAATEPVIVGGGCDGCEIMYVDMPGIIDAADTSAGWNERGQRLLVTGKLFKKNGITPQDGVILYYWQTDNSGHYSPVAGMNEKAKRHGHIRGWVKSGKEGTYSIYTIRPASYPGSNNPAHIHISVKEPGIKDEYYIDELVFDDDPFLTTERRKEHQNRGGSGILFPGNEKGMLVARHDIVLGLNIPGYPE